MSEIYCEKIDELRNKYKPHEEEAQDIVEEEPVSEQNKKPKQCRYYPKSIKRMENIFRICYNNGMTRPEIVESTGYAESNVWSMLNTLIEIGCMEKDETVYPTRFKSTAKNYPDFFQPLNTLIQPIGDINNPYARLLANKDMKPKDTQAYEDFIRDTSKHYIKELDDLITELHKICKLRIANRAIECPLCGKPLSKNISMLTCENPKCQIRSIDAGSVDKSLEMLTIIAKGMKQ